MVNLELKDVPHNPGVYTFEDAAGVALYVGKAVDLRLRLGSHLRDPEPRLVSMLHEAERVTWTICASETEALVVEARRIAALGPRYNIRLREPDAYPYLALVESPVGIRRVRVHRGGPNKFVQRFGPYPDRSVLVALRRYAQEALGLRTCTDGTFTRAQQSGRACLLYEMGQCSGPCIGAIDQAEHHRREQVLETVLKGKVHQAVRDVRHDMTQASAERQFERAARLRDLASALERVRELSMVQGLDGKDLDAVGLAQVGPTRAARLVCVRDGAQVATRTLVLEELVDDEELLARSLVEFYANTASLPAPAEVLLELESPDAAALVAAHYLKPVKVSVPHRGARRELLERARTDAHEALSREARRRDADPQRRASALDALGQALGIDAPWRIECFDISHTQGRVPVAGMVVLEDALPRTSQYRTFNVAPGGDDYAAMYEAVSRRYRATAKGQGALPGLVLIDGGPGQLAQARRALSDLGVSLPTAALAKRLEELWLSDETSVLLPRDSAALHVVQRARDEAHRFSRKAHRRRRDRVTSADTWGDLPHVSGLGPKLQQKLLDALGPQGIRDAEVESLREILPEKVAEALHQALRPPGT